MNSLSRRNRWPWTDQSGGARHPKRHRARLGTMGQHLARLTALALGVWLIWASPSDAFRDSQNIPDIDWSPLETYFEISQVDIGIGEHVTSLGKVLSESQITFIAEAKRSFWWGSPPQWVRLYDADNIQVDSRLLICKGAGVNIKRGERLRCSFGFTPSTHPTVKKIIFADH